jgi:hypothetical protein
MRYILVALASALLAVPAAAQPFYARGEWDSFGTTYPMIDSGDGIYFTRTIDGLFPGSADPASNDSTDYRWKVATEDYSIEAPAGFAQDVHTRANEAGEVHINFWNQTTWDDGWMPNDRRRVGYVDHNLYDWELMGSFNGFSTGLALTDQGGGLHTGTFAFDAGVYEWKFRRVGNWDTNIGNNGFSSNAGNNSFLVANDGDMWTFELDLPNGRWRTIAPAAPGQPGDHNGDGIVNQADYVAARKLPGSFGGDPGAYNSFKENFGEGSAAASWLVFGPSIETTPLDDQGGGVYSAVLDGLTPGTDYELKAAKSDLSVQVPGSNVKIRANDDGEIAVNFYELVNVGWDDGWQPNNEHRIGYEDHNEFDWELMGDFNGFATPVATLIDQTNGLHIGTYVVPTAGEHQFKFRQQGDWNTSIGNNFGNSASNASFTANADNELWQFELDLPNGKWRAFPVPVDGGSGGVPEPSAILLMVLAGLAICGSARRR